jgi:hypothetical protein
MVDLRQVVSESKSNSLRNLSVLCVSVVNLGRKRSKPQRHRGPQSFAVEPGHRLFTPDYHSQVREQRPVRHFRCLVVKG